MFDETQKWEKSIEILEVQIGNEEIVKMIFVMKYVEALVNPPYDGVNDNTRAVCSALLRNVN